MEHDHMIQALTPNGTNQSLDVGSLPGEGSSRLLVTRRPHPTRRLLPLLLITLTYMSAASIFVKSARTRNSFNSRAQISIFCAHYWIRSADGVFA
jgi:hypothetical protein